MENECIVFNLVSMILDNNGGIFCLWQIGVMKVDEKNNRFSADPYFATTEFLSQGPDFTSLFTVTKAVYTSVMKATVKHIALVIMHWNKAQLH